MGIHAGEDRQLATAHGVAGQHGCGEMERIEHLPHIFRKTLLGVPGGRACRCSITPARDAVNVRVFRKLPGKTAVHVRRVPATCEQHQRPSRSAPVEHFQLHSLVNRYKLDFVL